MEPVISFHAIPQSVNYGDSVDLVWNVSNADKITLLPLDMPLSNQGPFKVYPTKTMQYTIIASNNGNQVHKSIEVTVTQLPPIIHWTILPLSNNMFKVTWDIKYATHGFLQYYGSIPCQGSITLYLDESTIVRMFATNRFGSAHSEEHVQV